MEAPEALVQAPTASRSAVSMIPPYVSLQTIAGWIVMLLVATTLVAWMAVGFDIADARVLALEAAGRMIEPAEKRAYALTGAALLALQIALYGAVSTGFIIWTYAARSNLRALGARRLDYTTAWAVGGWFVPVLNLVRPYQVIAEIWKASDPATTEAVAWKQAPAPTLLKIWWLVFVAFACLEIVELITALSAGDVQAQFRFARGVSILADAGAAVAATLAYFVVTKITDAQDEKWDLREQYRAIDDDLLVLTAEKRTAPEPRHTAGRVGSRVASTPPARPSQRDAAWELAGTRFDADTAVQADGPGHYTARIDPGWWVVAGPNGGYIAALVLRALTRSVDDPERGPRSLTLHYTAPPLQGPARIETRIERTGRSLTNLSARLFQDDRLLAVALAAFSKPHDAFEYCHTPMPDVLPPEQCPVMEKHIEIHDRYEQRWAIGSPPFQGGDQALCGGWIRLPEPRVNDALSVAAFCDAFPPALFSSVRQGQIAGGLPTVELTIHFRNALPRVDAYPDDWVLAVFRSQLARDGFIEETGEIWSRDGVLLAQSRQLAIVR